MKELRACRMSVLRCRLWPSTELASREISTTSPFLRALPTLWTGSCSRYLSATSYRRSGPTESVASPSSCERSRRQGSRTASQVTGLMSFRFWSLIRVVWLIVVSVWAECAAFKHQDRKNSDPEDHNPNLLYHENFKSLWPFLPAYQWLTREREMPASWTKVQLYYGKLLSIHCIRKPRCPVAHLILSSSIIMQIAALKSN
jgi:hypothetical protein